MRLNLFVTFLLAATGLAIAAGQGQSKAVITYSSDPATLLISMAMISPELAEQDTTPLIRVYADGRVLTHYPVYLKQAGDYAMYLNTQELGALLAEVAPTLISFNKKSVKAQKDEADYQQVKTASSLKSLEFFAVADADISVFELNIESYRATASQKKTILSGPTKVSWQGLTEDAQHYRTVAPIQDLNQVAIRLRDLTDHQQLQSVEVQP